MQNVRSNKPVSAVLAVVLLIAQTGALAHAYEHDPGSPQDQVCSTCIAGQVLGSACVDSSPYFDGDTYRSQSGDNYVPAIASIHIPLARQRAPPTPL